MKKLMRTLLLTGICASIMTSGFAFADEIIETENNENRPGHERMTEEERLEKQAARQQRREEKESKKEMGDKLKYSNLQVNLHPVWQTILMQHLTLQIQ